MQPFLFHTVSVKTFLTRAAAAALMALVAVLCAFTTLRLFLHGREVTVPNLTDKSDEDAAKTLKSLGLNLSVENRFYSAAITPNHVLSQSPNPGAVVRRGWQVRVTESLGGQRVTVPDLTGQTARPAELILRRLNLEPAPAAHLPAPGTAGTVIAQSPAPNTTGLSGPRVALLVADDTPSADSAAYVMPQLTGLSLYAANTRLAAAGLHIGAASDPTYTPPAPDPSLNPVPSPTDPTAAPNAATTTPDPAIPPTITSPPPVNPSAIITSQTPAPGHKVTRADTIRVSASLPHTPQFDQAPTITPISPLTASDQVAVLNFEITTVILSEAKNLRIAVLAVDRSCLSLAL